MSDSKFVSQADYWKDRAERAEAKLAELERQEPVVKYSGKRLTPEGTKEMWGYLLSEVEPRENQELYARPVPSEDSFVTVTTTEDGRCVMVSRQDEDHRILKVLWEAKDVPTEPVTVAFGKRGKNMFFKIGNQSFLLDYKPEEQAEFDFMKEMLLSAFYRITQGVKTEIQPVNARLLDALKRAKGSLVAFKLVPEHANCWEPWDEENLTALNSAIAAAEAQQERPAA